ncbi:hypothetical protein ACFTSD_12630 [Nocardiaceae bacterium NPDC056970]
MALSLLEGDALHMEVGDGGLIGNQLAYCFGLEHQGILDGCIVSPGFVLRTPSGGAAATIHLSQWFQLIAAGEIAPGAGTGLRAPHTNRTTHNSNLQCGQSPPSS